MNEWENIKTRIKKYAQRIDLLAEREKFENWQTQCGITVDTNRHCAEYGYGGMVSGRTFDRWEAWLARAVQQENNQ